MALTKIKAGGLGAGAVDTTAAIADGAVSAGDIATGAVTAAPGNHLATNAVVSGTIANDAVTTAAIADDAITSALIADDSINSEHYVDGSIDHQHLADDCVDGDNIADNSVGLAHMAGGTDGVIITYDASGDPVHVGPGNDGQVLTSTGAGSPPAFEDLPVSGASLTGSTNNTVVTVTGSNAMTGEANLTFDGNDLTLGDGNVILASGHGISFSATADSSGTMDNELFDDYEEGSCNGVHLEFGGTDAGSVDSGYSQGRYVKIGTLVWCSGYLKMDMTSPAPSGGAKLCDLPYSVHEFGQPHNWVSIGHWTSNGKCTDSNVILMIGNSGGSKVHLGHDDTSDVHYLTDTSFGTGQWLHAQYDLIYRTTA